MKIYSIRTGKELTEREIKVVTKKDAINKLLDAEEMLKSLGLTQAADEVAVALNTIIVPMSEEEFNQVV